MQADKDARWAGRGVVGTRQAGSKQAGEQAGRHAGAPVVPGIITVFPSNDENPEQGAG